jgi:hypothetical protein
MADPEQAVLQSVNENGEIADSGVFASTAGLDHSAVVGVLKSLLASEMITLEVDPTC